METFDLRPCEKNNSTRPQLENQSQCRRKTTQLVSRNELNSTGETTQLGNMNETTQRREKTTQLSSRNEQLNSATQERETTQLVAAYNRLQPPATAYDRLQPPTTAYSRLQPPATACNRLQPPTTACNRLQPPAPPAPPLQQNRLFYLLACMHYIIQVPNVTLWD
ncbi:hypothetical protein TNCV_1933891 [Trichonephila clavipes]|nr:hypothetical protein TNCV_1933891 [Trichonephila clavipes]